MLLCFVCSFAGLVWTILTITVTTFHTSGKWYSLNINNKIHLDYVYVILQQNILYILLQYHIHIV